VLPPLRDARLDGFGGQARLSSLKAISSSTVLLKSWASVFCSTSRPGRRLADTRLAERLPKKCGINLFNREAQVDLPDPWHRTSPCSGRIQNQLKTPQGQSPTR
jgi:hypothetical protein